jgi:outer membrane protein assembly factor BamB
MLLQDDTYRYYPNSAQEICFLGGAVFARDRQVTLQSNIMKALHSNGGLILSLILAQATWITSSTPAAVHGWLYWRGPQQNGTSLEKDLSGKLDLNGPSHLWTADVSGQSTAVIADGRLYILGYAGEGPDLQELISCRNAETGRQLWERRFNDFLSDIIYTRYSTSSPTIDPETGHVYMQGSQGVFVCFGTRGQVLWEHSMMEEYGRMTFPNGRTTSPVVDGDLVITHGITANWGANGPAADRFYAFDKKTGKLVWYSTPGARPKDSSYAPPTLAWWHGQRVFYCGTGDGCIVCVNARTGKPIWRVKITQGGVNTAILIHNNDKLITIHSSENLDTSEVGRMVAVRIPETVPAGSGNGPFEFPMKDLELWRNPLSAFSSSPILVGDRVYQVAETGDLCAIDAQTGKILWKHKIGIEQRNASLLYADGKLYVPMLDDPDVKEGATTVGKGAFYVIEPGDTDCRILSHLSLDGRCFGSPTVYNGKIYIQTTKKLYCFGKKGPNRGLPPPPKPEPWPAPGPATELQIIPSEVLLTPGHSESFRIRKLDAKGLTVEEIRDPRKVHWVSYIPPTAKVKAHLKASFDAEGRLVADRDPVPSAGAFEASLDGLKGYIRGRVLPDLPIRQDFESFNVSETHPAEGHPEPGLKFAYPPLPWIGARFKFEVQEREGDKVLAKTIDNKLFQRGTVFLGRADMKNYTAEADLLSDGSRRKMSEVGLINQHYIILLKGNSQTLEVNSNLERIKASVPFSWKPGVWYHLKTRVDVAGDGSGMVRAKAWRKGEPEPAGWTIEVPHRHAHASGSPGLFGFSPQSMKVYIDNISITPNH